MCINFINVSTDNEITDNKGIIKAPLIIKLDSVYFICDNCIICPKKTNRKISKELFLTAPCYFIRYLILPFKYQEYQVHFLLSNPLVACQFVRSDKSKFLIIHIFWYFLTFYYISPF